MTRLNDRRISDIPASQIETLMGHSIRMALKRRLDRGADNSTFWAEANRDFGERVVRRGFGDADTVYGFNAAAVEIFRAARRQGLKTVLDQTMAPWTYVETLLSQERERWPDWEPVQRDGHWNLLADREAEEWELADAVICGSPFVVSAVEESGGDTERCRVVPYGYTAPPIDPARYERSRRPLRVLFVGTVELRKGVPYLLEAVRRIGGHVLDVRLVGRLRVQPDVVTQLRQHLEVVGPIPRSEVQRQYRWADLLVLPTLAEGSANVCYEAMSYGLPVITTPNAGSVVRDGVDGYLVAPCDSEALSERLCRFVDDRELLEAMGASASARAKEFSWTRYDQQLPATLREALCTQPQPIPQALEVK